MSRPCVWFVAVLASLILAAPALSQSVAELEARVQRLETELAEATRQDDSVEAEHRARAIERFVLVEVGGFRIRTAPEIENDTRRAAEVAWGVLSHSYQDGIAASITRIPFAAGREPADSGLEYPVRWFPSGSVILFAPVEDQVRGLAVNLIAQAYQRIWLEQDRPLQNWLGSPPAVSVDTAGDLERAYLDLATSPSPAARHCLESAAGCSGVLGLLRPNDPGVEWYSPAGRRALAIERNSELRVGDTREVYDRCIAGSDRDCQALLRLNPQEVPLVLQPATRMSFLRTALKRGGAASYSRLMQTAGTLNHRIESASQLTLDSIVADWHRQMLAARPEPTPVRTRQVAAALGWSVLLLALALRSSRWR